MEQAPWLAVFRSRRMAVLFLLTKANVPLDEIAAFSLVGLAYTFKFAWAPLLALVAAIVAMGLVDPVTDPGLLAVLAVIVAALSASQDVVLDAYTSAELARSR
jgi:PAT family beta-lactamase induction signal transducer AmpG